MSVTQQRSYATVGAPLDHNKPVKVSDENYQLGL